MTAGHFDKIIFKIFLMALEISGVLCFKYPGSRSADYDMRHFTIIIVQAGSVYKLSHCAMFGIYHYFNSLLKGES